MHRSLAVLACSMALFAAGCQITRSPEKSGTRQAGVQVPPRPPVDTVRLDSLIKSHVASQALVGLSVGVAQDGKIVFVRGYGVRSLVDKAPVTPQTMFAIGSVTKQFTCSAALVLAEQRKLSMQDPVAKYFPDLTRAGDITLLQLGQHVSGYRDYYPLDFVDRKMHQPATAQHIITEYATRPLDFEPGSRWSYSNTNFLILGSVVERVSGMAFGDFLRQQFFTPLGMAHTAFEPARGGADMAQGYTSFALSAPMPATPEADGWAGAAGAIWSTPTDLLTWDLGLIGGKVLQPESYKLLTTPRVLSDGRSSGYGCGEGVNDRGAAIVLSHGGAVAGFVARNTVVPATRSAVVLLANADFGSIGALHDAILDMLLPRVDVPAISGPPALEAGKAFLARLSRGEVDRSTLGEDFDAFLTADLLAGARASLRNRPISDVRLVRTSERGGMAVATFRFKAGSDDAGALMYRTPDGKIQEFLVFRQ